MPFVQLVYCLAGAGATGCKSFRRIGFSLRFENSIEESSRMWAATAGQRTQVAQVDKSNNTTPQHLPSLGQSLLEVVMSRSMGFDCKSLGKPMTPYESSKLTKAWIVTSEAKKQGRG